MLFIFLSMSLLSVINGIPLITDASSALVVSDASAASAVINGIPLITAASAVSDASAASAASAASNLMNEIMFSKDDHKVLLNIIADADPEKLNDIVELVRSLISESESELAGLISSSDAAVAAYDDAVTTHDTALSTQTIDVEELAKDLSLAKAVAQSLHESRLLIHDQDLVKANAVAQGVYEQSNTESQLMRDQSDDAAQSTHDQGIATIQGVVDVAKSAVDAASEIKNTANGVLAAERVRLDSEVATLHQIIALIQGVIGINTVAPTTSPTTSPTLSPTLSPTRLPSHELAVQRCSSFGSGWSVVRTSDKSITCAKSPTTSGSNCDTCDSWRLLVFQNGGTDQSPGGQTYQTKAGYYYGGHSPCQSGWNLPECGLWNV